MSVETIHPPQSIVVVIHSLTGGGSEHAAAMMANYWVRQGRSVTLITLDSVGHDAIAVDSKVNRVGLGLLSPSKGPLEAIAANYKRVSQLRKAIKDAAPDVVVSLTDRMNVVTILACLRTDLRVVVAERTDPRHHSIGSVWERLRRWTYPKASAIVVQTESVREVVIAMSGRTPVRVIPNAIRSQESNDSKAAPQLDSSKHWIIGVGRLSREKGFDRLIGAFAKIASESPGWNLVLVGDGPERANLEEQSQQLVDRDRVLFVGWTTNVGAIMEQADVFVLPSRYEGFPNALLEAMSLGVASIAVDCESGPREIIRAEINGLLSPTGDDAQVESELARNVRRLIDDSDLRQRLGEAARSVATDYNQDLHFRSWDDLFAELLKA